MGDTGAAERPLVAGMYDYYLGGTANTPADRAAVERIRQLIPDVEDGAWANRGFLQRAVRTMAGQWGISQFLDIGAGLPTQRNTHEVVADARPDGHVVYVDVEPRVIERGSRLLAGLDGTVIIQADVRAPERVLNHPDTRRLIDFSRPVGLLLVAVTQFMSDADDPWGVVRRYVDALAPGSHLALSAPTSDHQAERIVDEVRDIYAATPSPANPRSRAEIERFFTGLEILPPYEGAAPGLTYAGIWGAEDPVAADSEGSRWFYAAVGRKN